MKVVRLRATERPRRDPSVACGAAMREAREAAGADLSEGARRLNLAMGSSIISAGLLACWESGAEMPSADVFVHAVRLAGEGAAGILASLA